MADLGEIVEELRTAENNSSGHEDENDPIRRGSTKRRRSRKRRNSGGSQGVAQPSQKGQVHEERRDEHESERQNIQQHVDGKKQDVSPIQEGYEARFYADYRKVADEYDKEFLKKHDEDLNTTLIFAGLFSAVTSAFIVQVDSQLQPDPGDETAALLRVLIYQNNHSAFGDNVPTLPQWTGPPPTMIHVQAILFASLVASLLSAFLAMLGKQWLNRYASADMRGSAVERCQNRQRKLDGIIAWYFDHVMESLPLMLQGALLLLGCALSRYLWNISVAVASVVISITSFGFAFYIFIVIAGATSENCPYQTPGSHILRHLGPKVWRTVYSASSSIGSARPAIISSLRSVYNQSYIIGLIVSIANSRDSWWSVRRIIPFFGELILKIPLTFLFDIFVLGRAAIRVLPALPVGAYHLVRSAKSRLYSTYSTLKRTLDQQTTPSDFRCVSWTLQTSLDKPIHLTALEHLVTKASLTGLDPTLSADCFNVFVGCVRLDNHKLVVMQGLEQLGAVSVRCFFHSIRHLWMTDPTSSVLADLRRRYTRVFPCDTDFRGIPFYRTITIVHALAHEFWGYCNLQWDDYRPSGQEYIPFARHMVKIAQVEYQRMQRKKLPRWILRFALHSLSLDPPSPPSVVSDCLMIVAIDLGYDVSNIFTLDESARLEQVSSLITRGLGSPTPSEPRLFPQDKAIATLFSYAVRLEQDGPSELVDSILRTVGTKEDVLRWRQIETQVAALFDEQSPPFLNRVITLAAPGAYWRQDGLNNKNAIDRWAAAASAVPYSEEVGQCVINTLFRILMQYPLRPLIPIKMWAWLKNPPSLPPLYWGISYGFWGYFVGYVRGLGDIEIYKAYLLLFWSEWNFLWPVDFMEMVVSMREDFGGIGMWYHRDDLIKHLGNVQGGLDRGLEYFKQRQEFITKESLQERKERYERLESILLEVDGGAMKILTQSHTTFTCALPLPCP